MGSIFLCMYMSTFLCLCIIYSEAQCTGPLLDRILISTRRILAVPTLQRESWMCYNQARGFAKLKQTQTSENKPTVIYHQVHINNYVNYTNILRLCLCLGKAHDTL